MTDMTMLLARIGAVARVAAIHTERTALLAAFPDLARSATLDDVTPSAPERRRRPPMTAAQRKAVGRRMKAYWRERRRLFPAGRP